MRIKWLMLSLALVIGCRSVLATADDVYLKALASGWEARAVLSVGEAAQNGYRMAGVPDGLGAFDNGDGTLTVLMNHEIPADKGVVRAHGSKGGFVSRWVVRLADLKVTQGADMVRQASMRAWPKNICHLQNIAFSRAHLCH